MSLRAGTAGRTPSGPGPHGARRGEYGRVEHHAEAALDPAPITMLGSRGVRESAAISFKNLLRRVGPEQVAHSTFATSVEVTGARNALFPVISKTGREGISPVHLRKPN